MKNSQAFTSNSNNNPKLYLSNMDIAFLLSLAKKLEDIISIGQEKLDEIYHKIEWYCKSNVEFDPVETYKEIKKIVDVINKFENIKEEISEEIIRGYITKKDEISKGIIIGCITKNDQPKSFEKFKKYREFLE